MEGWIWGVALGLGIPLVFWVLALTVGNAFDRYMDDVIERLDRIEGKIEALSRDTPYT